jgi:hypothetical protein
MFQGSLLLQLNLVIICLHSAVPEDSHLNTYHCENFVSDKELCNHLNDNCTIELHELKITLSGLVVIMLAIGPKIHGFKPSRGRWIFKVIKVNSTTSFGGEVKPLIPCRILKIPTGIKKDTS